MLLEHVVYVIVAGVLIARGLFFRVYRYPGSRVALYRQHAVPQIYVRVRTCEQRRDYMSDATWTTAHAHRHVEDLRAYARA